MGLQKYCNKFFIINSQLKIIYVCVYIIYALTNTFCGDAFDVMMSAVSCIACAHMAACC